ncbi:hypothetical protein PGT21_029962 [Puccinia graminis f. sp. tritici]|uniref:PITH domain-containing protein n=2 Tax=Puccinia graminis f. sp. tritici TaxID=56615 RepID=E3L053_PUCGT|nr:uncharacterized protein PGTG_16228 [Puccinia graminis f. sp. tritici CRL 75-36-700-3]EFP89940.1 hypothetical protein PGTG_16228 [Puccinia graminis f. sp. tritici CRL 75-36-700-3]KAA1094730.1 hypothetical protein PGT21_028953 [Puccinia graminis f. sp. tritici]KAA1108971.1 hypothetical protein PGT21_029962 [Puccinia graminis f. sp. tritici]KAA1121571.1 hypothetical protein PGTUg99_032474 [Puccinia graminis f. sp. tritici]
MPVNNCEGDLTGVDFEQLDPSTSADVFSRAAGGSNSYSLYPYIDQSKSYCLNVDQPPSSSTTGRGGHTGIGAIIRPIHTRNELSPEESLVTHQDTGPEMIVHVVFNQPVRARTIVINVAKGDQSPRLARVWTNRSNAISFDQVDDLKPDQEWELDVELETAVEYPTRVTRFQSVSSLSFEFRDPSAGQRSRIYFLGVLGDVKQLKRDPSSQLTVGAENSADATLDSIREQSGGNQTTIR